jgi:hypothetical protein
MSHKPEDNKLLDRALSPVERAIFLVVVFNIKEAFYTRRRELPDEFYEIYRIFRASSAPKVLELKGPFDQFKTSFGNGDYGSMPDYCSELLAAMDELLAGGPTRVKKTQVSLPDESGERLAD